jgi:hypothetical protein
MKAYTKYGLKGYNGNVDGMVFYTLPNCDTMIGRRKPVHFVEAAQHEQYRQINNNLWHIEPSQAYKDDFKVYTALYKELPEAKKSVSGWYNLYIKLLWDMQKAGLVDLKTLTREQIYNDNLPCKSVKTAVEAGLLPAVVKYELLTSLI